MFVFIHINALHPHVELFILPRDPQAMIDFAKALYTDVAFYAAVHRGLTQNGILISQIGESASVLDPSDLYSPEIS